MKKLLLLILFFTAVYYSARLYVAWHYPNSDMDTRVGVEIEKGSSLSIIADTLAEKGLIKDSWAFRTYVRWNGLGRKLQAGNYVIQRNLTYEELVQVLQQGKSEEVKITIPEGYTIAQMDELLAKRSLIESGEFQYCAAHCEFSVSRESMEGYLFPSTYYVKVKNFNVQNFISRLTNTFDQQLSPFMPEILSGDRDLEEIVIVASMIEREANNPAEMPKISDVMWKRLDEGIPLGVDATTRYALNDWSRPLYTEDFQTESPYNTRRKRGLPPTAISNPGIEALKAAIYPESTPYYYYLHDSSGKIHFAKDLDEHNQQKNLYLR